MLPSGLNSIMKRYAGRDFILFLFVLLKISLEICKEFNTPSFSSGIDPSGEFLLFLPEKRKI